MASGPTVAAAPPGSLAAIMGENLPAKTRQSLLGEIGGMLATRLKLDSVAVVGYTANTMNPAAAAAAQMNLTHETPLFDVLTDARRASDNLAIILNTLGGDGTLPTRVVRFVKEGLGAKSFRVIVVHLAKSAGTLLALAADEVIAGPTSQFGPIDPQLPRVTNSGQSWVSARAVKESYERLIGGTLATLPPAAQVGVASTIDWLLYQQALDAIKFTKEFVSTIRSTTHPKLDEKSVIAKLIETPLSHGTDVSPTELASYGLPVTILPLGDSLWTKLSEYDLRAQRSLQMEQAPPPTTGIVLFESAHLTSGLNAMIGAPGK